MALAIGIPAPFRLTLSLLAQATTVPVAAAMVVPATTAARLPPHADSGPG